MMIFWGSQRLRPKDLLKHSNFIFKKNLLTSEAIGDTAIFIGVLLVADIIILVQVLVRLRGYFTS
jgi:hypothetical protein